VSGMDERDKARHQPPVWDRRDGLTETGADELIIDDGEVALDGALTDEPVAVDLTEEELALVRSFQSSDLRHRITPGDHAVPAPSGTSQPAARPPALWPAMMPTAEDLDYIPPEMRRLFLVETAEDLQELRALLLAYEQRPDEPATLPAMGRITHKIKGTAATLGYETLAAVTHSVEDVIKALQSRRAAAGSQANRVLVQALVLLGTALDSATESGEIPVAANDALVAEARCLVETLLRGDASVADPVPVEDVVPPVPAEGAAESILTPAEDAGAPRAGRASDAESWLRIEVRRLDELMRHLSALAVNRAALLLAREDVLRLQGELTQSLRRLDELSTQLADLRPLAQRIVRDASQAAPQAPQSSGFRLFGRREREGRAGEMGAAGAPLEASQQRWDALELERFTESDHALRSLTEVLADLDTTGKQLHTALKRLAEATKDQADLAGHMQRDVMHVRLVPLSSIVPRLELEVRHLAQVADREVSFSVSGDMTEIDRNISETLAEPLLQLVRNAVVHGIEPREERLEQGKPPTASVWLHAYYLGSEVIIEIGDDGRGLNPHRLAASAVAAEVLSADAARGLSTAEALDLMFVPGVTTFEEARTYGGRGIGLDEVRTTIQQLRGSIQVRSELGQGTVFRVRVPISLSIVRALRVCAAGQSLAVPFSSVQRTLSLSASEILTTALPPTGETSHATKGTRMLRRIRIERAAGEPGVADSGYDEMPVYPLAELLGLAYEARDPQTALVIEVGRRQVALLVDELREDQEVVVQSLPPHLRRQAVRGASIMPNGEMLLVLDLPDLVGDILDGTRLPPAPRPRLAPIPDEALTYSVLVVDDSVSIRRTLEHTLERVGFDVRLARDGIEALEQILLSTPRVVVLDIEMPRLDGFELLSILRDTPRFAGVRVAMLTSRASDKHRQYAFKLGADAYLIKPCPQETLVETVRSLLMAAPQRTE
jgi:chemosensory pili system protein ChpA (sensor histidine kinase/response regulator)